MNKELRIVFMGTPDFAVQSLSAILDAGYNVVGVITSPDKPAGRGHKISESSVKKFAVSKGLNILQPTNLKSPEFIAELKALNANLQIVVAFRMLPEVVWNMPKFGTFNLHASLLPQYRGAAPINWAVINGEKETGVTTFFLQHKIDTGNIIFQEKVSILAEDNAGDVHDKLMNEGSKLVVKTIKAIEFDTIKPIPQNELITSELKEAPKIYKETCLIDWNNNMINIHNHIRGLSPYPAAWTYIYDDNNNKISVKIFKSELIQNVSGNISFESDDKTFIRISNQTGTINVLELQVPGKKRMNTEDFLRGSRNVNEWKIAIE